MPPSTQTILVGDDDPHFCQVMEIILGASGYAVLIAPDGHALVRMAREQLPDLVLVDLMMPLLDGYEALRQLRNDTRTAHLPLIIVSSRGASADLVGGFESGADDFVTKPIASDELLARIRGHLRRAARRPVHNPLTGLPGNILLVEEIRFRMRRGRRFALLHIDLSGFKAFNDNYGFARGDRVLHRLAEVLRDTVAESGGGEIFLGHIGGDDFAILCGDDEAERLAHAAVARFAERAPELYDPADLARGFLAALDRHGIPRSYPIMGLNIGGVLFSARRHHAPEELGRAAAAMRQRAKERGPSGYAIDVDADLPPREGP